MKEFIEKLIGRLEETLKTNVCKFVTDEDCELLDCAECEKTAIRKFITKLAEEHNDRTMINEQYCWQTCGATEHCKECNRLCNGSIDYYENYDFMAEEYKGGWISVEERLPESGVSVIISYKDRFLSQADGTCDGWYDANNMIWHLTDYEYSDNVEVIAWRERLAPYQPKGE